MDFSKVKTITLPEGNVTKVEYSGKTIWQKAVQGIIATLTNALYGDSSHQSKAKYDGKSYYTRGDTFTVVPGRSLAVESYTNAIYDEILYRTTYARLVFNIDGVTVVDKHSLNSTNRSTDWVSVSDSYPIPTNCKSISISTSITTIGSTKYRNVKVNFITK